MKLSSISCILLAATVGCCASNQPLASGRVQLASANNFAFSGDTLELRAKDKPTQIAFGQIQADGSFEIESLKDGALVRGAPAGSYEARLVIADDDYAHKADAKKVIPKKYFSFETSKLTVEIPNQRIELRLAK